MEDKQSGDEQSREANSELETNLAKRSLDDPRPPSFLLPQADFKGKLEDGQQSPATASEEVIKSRKISSSIQLLMEEMQRLREDFETKVKYDESKERLINTLHKELQTYREGFHFKILRPVFIDLISMHDDLDRIQEDIAMKENGISHTMLRNLHTFQESIEEILR